MPYWPRGRWGNHSRGVFVARTVGVAFNLWPPPLCPAGGALSLWRATSLARVARATRPGQRFRLLNCVPWRGLEPPRPKDIGPQPTAYANSATRAIVRTYYSRIGAGRQSTSLGREALTERTPRSKGRKEEIFLAFFASLAWALLPTVSGKELNTDGAVSCYNGHVI